MQASNKILEKYKDMVVDPYEASQNRGLLSTGSITLDAALGGGIRIGNQAQIWGKNSVGKTTIAYGVARSVLRLGDTLKSGGLVHWFDFEKSIDIGPADADELTPGQTRTRAWLQVNGIDPFDPRFKVLRPWTAEDFFAITCALIEKNASDLIVCDSVAAMMSRRAAEGEVGQATYGALSALLSSEMPRINLSHAKGKNRHTTVLFINQARANLSSPHGGDKPYGGEALRHYVRQSIMLRPGQGSKIGDLESTSVTNFRIEKNSFHARKEGAVVFASGRGLDVTREVLLYAIDAGYARKSGAWFNFYDRPEDAAGKVEPVGKVQGESAAKLWMEQNGWVERLYDEALQGAMAHLGEEDEDDL
jgi:recombination protein RecA